MNSQSFSLCFSFSFQSSHSFLSPFFSHVYYVVKYKIYIIILINELLFDNFLNFYQVQSLTADLIIFQFYFQQETFFQFQLFIYLVINLFQINKFVIIQMLTKENKKINIKLPENFNGDLEGYIQILYEHQKTCERSGKYIQADLAKKKLIELKSELQKKTKQQMKSKHQNERSEVQKAHLEQFNQFNQYWDQKLEEYEQQAQRITQEAKKRHKQEMEQFQNQIENSLGCKPKQTSQIINLKKIEENLARQQNYQQAHKVQQKILQLEKIEYDRWNFTKMNKIKNLLQQLYTKQQNQLGVLKQRIQAGFQEQKKQRSIELDKLLQKYQNFMKELENQHHQQITKFDKSIKMQSNMSVNVSRMSRALLNKN